MRLLALALLLSSTMGCATAKMATNDVKTYLRKVDDQYNCIGVEIGEESAICVDDIAITVTVVW